MSDLYLDQPPEAERRVTRLFVWIATHAGGGGEGIVSADLPTLAGPRHMPLMASDRDTAAALEPFAQRARQAAMHQASRRITRLRLVEFVREGL